MQCLEHLAFKHSINIYLINIHLPNEQINTYLSSEMSLTSNEETENTLSQKSLFWNRKGAGKSQEKAECPLLFKSQNILPFR